MNSTGIYTRRGVRRNMETYRQDLGFYSSKGPLSSTAGKILTALQSFPADQVFQNDLNQENVCNGIYNLEVHQNVDSEWDHRTNHPPLDGQLQLDHREQSVTSTSENEFHIFDTAGIFSAPSISHGFKEQTSASKQVVVSPVLRTSAAASSPTSPDISPVSRTAPTDFQPSTLFSNIHDHRNGKTIDEGTTTLVLNALNVGQVPSPKAGCEKRTANSPELTAMRTCKRRPDKADGGDKMALYNLDCVTQEEQLMLLEEVRQAKALVLTMVFHNGSSLLSASKDSSALFKGILVLIKKGPARQSNKDNRDREDIYVHLNVGEDACWRRDQTHGDFIRKLVLLLFQSDTPGICFSAKDYLRSVVPVFKDFISWKIILQSLLLDPQIAAWLLDPVDSNPTFGDLVKKYGDTMETNIRDQQDIYKKLNVLYYLMESLEKKLKFDRLWDLFYTLELPLTTILAVMENQRIQVNKEELKKTSSLLGIHLKDLEHEAHHAAGERFRLTSSKELREVLYEKLQLHLQCKCKLPRTNLCRFPSTAEPALHLLKGFHPLPGIILQFRQIQKIKSTFVDGLSVYISKGCVSPTWNQTGTVSGRLSAKHPNIQGISKLSVQYEMRQKEQGQDKEMVTINPRSMFISAKGHTFLAADFAQIELRLLAHFSTDPELLHLFHDTKETDVFTKLTSLWKDLDYKNVTQADREQTKRIIYSVIYGVGKERLSESLGTTPAEANKFIESFLQKYRVNDFTQSVIQECRRTGFVLSLMGRKRPLPHINSKDYRLRAQAERQAVNFAIQGSAADLCKLAMIKISAFIASSSRLTARLIAQIHDELLFEVEDTQLLEVAGLVKDAMEGLQHAEGVKLQVPLQVTLSCGKSWGSMAELPVM